MTTDGTGAEAVVIGGVAGDAYHVTDGTIVVAVATRGGSRVGLLTDARSAHRPAEQLRQQVRLFEAHRAETEPARGAEVGP